MTERPKAQARILTFVSGKGGAGKTSVALATARILSTIGRKVLFIDFDVETHGASYFFAEYDDRAFGIMEFAGVVKARSFAVVPDPATMILAIDPNIDFVPSKTQFKKKSWEICQDSRLMAFTLDHLIHLVRQRSYDYVIIDTQAGPTYTTRYAAKLSSVVILVSEPDPISVAASRNFEHEVRDELTSPMKFLVNKLNKEEIASFRAIKDYLTSFDHLTPLPFDFEVRKAFALRDIPVDVAKPTPFLFGLLDTTSELLRNEAPELKAVQTKLRQTLLGEVKLKKVRSEDRITSLLQMLAELKEYRVRLETRTRSRRAILLSLGVMLCTVAIVSVSLIAGGDRYYFLATSTVAGVILGLIPIAYDFLTKRTRRSKTEIETRIESIQRELEAEREQDQLYESILLKRMEDFMLEKEKS